MQFFVGLHQPSDASHFSRCFISVGRLRTRKSPFKVRDWIMDSQAFSTLALHGGYAHPVSEYAAQIHRWRCCGRMLAAVAQDYMCEPAMLKRTGLSVPQHQRLTIERYDALLGCGPGAYIMPVLQGYQPEDYLRHLEDYGDRLAPGAWVGVGSVCKRNSSPCLILDVLIPIKQARPDLRLHGFGLKITALYHGTIRSLLWSADSMAWSYAARREGLNANDWVNALDFTRRIERLRNSSNTQKEVTYACRVPSPSGN